MEQVFHMPTLSGTLWDTWTHQTQHMSGGAELLKCRPPSLGESTGFANDPAKLPWMPKGW